MQVLMPLVSYKCGLKRKLQSVLMSDFLKDLKLSKGSAPREKGAQATNVLTWWRDKMCSAEETGLVSFQFVRTCGWSQHSLSSEGTLLGAGWWE